LKTVQVKMAIVRTFGMFWVITVQFSMTVETDRNKVILIIVGRISIYVVDLNICGTSFTTKATMASAPQKQLGARFFWNRDSLSLLHFITSL